MRQGKCRARKRQEAELTTDGTDEHGSSAINEIIALICQEVPAGIIGKRLRWSSDLSGASGSNCLSVLIRVIRGKIVGKCGVLASE
jgi:hypothetical protein